MSSSLFNVICLWIFENIVISPPDNDLNIIPIVINLYTLR